VSITLPGGSAVTNAWNSQNSGTTGTVRFGNAPWNGRLTAGGTTEFGFQGTGSAPTGTPVCTAS
jgi:hypothetical protein